MGVHQLIYRRYRLVSSLLYWVRRHLTPAGWTVLAGLVVTGALGMDTDQTVAYQAFTLLLGLLAVALVGSRGFRIRFAATRILPRFGTVGQPLRYHVELVNLSPRAQAGLTIIDDLSDPRPSFEEYRSIQRTEARRMRSFKVFPPRSRLGPMAVAPAEQPVPALPPKQPAEVALEVVPLRRGVLRFAGVTLARSDPLGLFRSLVQVRQPASVLILPRRYPLPAIALPGQVKYQQGGVALASSVGESEEFISLRDYRRGDPLRHIHWRSWAKAGRPIVKEFQDEFFVRHALILDTFIDDPDSEVFEEAVSIAASFACTLQTQESLLDLLFVGPQAYCFTTGRGLAHTDQILEILASVRICGEKPFETLTRLVLNHAGLVSGCICVMLDWDPPRWQMVERLKQLGVPVMVLVVRAADETEPLDPGPMRDQPGEFHALQAGDIETGLAKL